jgi:hypothetical protein
VGKAVAVRPASTASAYGGEPLAVAAIEEAREADRARLRAHRRLVEGVDLGERQAAHPLERVRPPGAVVDGVRHGLAELAVADQGDASGPLALDDVGDGLGRERLELGRRAA